MKAQDPERIRQVAKELDDTLEAMDKEMVLEFFTEDCEVRFLGRTLEGKAGVMKWLRWLESNGMAGMKLTPINIEVMGDMYLEEFLAEAILKDGTRLKAEQCEVLVYRDYKVKSLRLYFDRIQYAPMVARDLLSRTVVKKLDRMTFRGLDD